MGAGARLPVEALLLSSGTLRCCGGRKDTAARGMSGTVLGSGRTAALGTKTCVSMLLMASPRLTYGYASSQWRTNAAHQHAPN
jgi:hypothetical protein